MPPTVPNGPALLASSPSPEQASPEAEGRRRGRGESRVDPESDRNGIGFEGCVLIFTHLLVIRVGGATRGSKGRVKERTLKRQIKHKQTNLRLTRITIDGKMEMMSCSEST